MKALIKRYWNDVFWRNNVVFLTGSLFVAFINYLYYPVLGRLLSVSAFGEVQALLSIFNLVGMLLSAFNIVVINIAANARKNGAQTIQQFEHLALLVMSALFMIMLAFSLQLQQFFNFTSYLPFTLLGVIFIVSVPLSFRRAFVQGKQDFTAVSISNAVAASGKLLLSALLVVVGLSTFGAMAGILLSQLIALIYTVAVAKKLGFTTAVSKRLVRPDMTLLKPELKFLFSVMAVFLVVTFLYTGDILVVKRYFDPEVAGQYAGISAIAKIIFFATASFAGVLLASVGQAHSKTHNYQISRKSLVLVCAGGGALVGIFTLVPEFIITLLLGSRYAGYAHLLPLVSLLVYLVSIANLFFYYFLALRRYVIVPIAITGGATTLLLTALRHNSLQMVIQNFMTGSVLVLLLVVAASLLTRCTPTSKEGAA